jgi:stage V sporulation protein B
MKKMPIFYNALLLTGVNLLLRLVSTSFQVFLSGRIGAAGVGLLQLVLSVAFMTQTCGMAGIRTATMYLTAEELGKGRGQNVTWVLSACFSYSLLFSACVGALVYGFAPLIAENWICDIRTLPTIRLFAAFLPVSCFVGVMVGYFTAANRIATLAAVEVAEQLCTMAVTTMALLLWAGKDSARACQCVVFGSCAGSLLTLACLVILRLREKAETGPAVKMSGRLVKTALPLAVADDLKVGINTVENLMVPKRLSLFTGDALAQFGMVSGMVFPVLMFPASILYALADLLIPEMARCNAAGSQRRIRYLARRGLRVALLYGLGCGGVLFVLSRWLCVKLYHSDAAGEYLAAYAFMVPMLYCDAIIDAMNKGLGLQSVCVRVNIFTAILDVVGLYILLPRMGMWGYFLSFLLSHLINAGLSLRLLLKQTGLRIGLHIPLLTMGAMIGSGLVAKTLPTPVAKVAVFLLLVYPLLSFCGILYKEDLLWLRRMALPQKKSNIL